jgi:hypothetical protein
MMAKATAENSHPTTSIPALESEVRVWCKSVIETSHSIAQPFNHKIARFDKARPIAANIAKLPEFANHTVKSHWNYRPQRVFHLRQDGGLSLGRTSRQLVPNFLEVREWRGSPIMQILRAGAA